MKKWIAGLLVALLLVGSNVITYNIGRANGAEPVDLNGYYTQEQLEASYEQGFNDGGDDAYQKGYCDGYADGQDWPAEEEDDVASDDSCEEEFAAESEDVVYITDTGEKYHRDGCRYLSQSQHDTTVSKAAAAGYTPCSVCDP